MAAATAQRKPIQANGPYQGMTSMTPSQAKDRLPTLAMEAGLGDPGVVLTSHGREIAVVIGAREFERLKEIEKQHNKKKE